MIYRVKPATHCRVETGYVIRVTFEELERLMKTVIECEIDRGLYISDSEKEEYKALIEDYFL